MASIQWRTGFVATTEDAAITEHKGILLDFLNPESDICKLMEKTTYSNSKVVSFINDHLQPYRVDFNEQTFFEEYNVIWTPTLIFLDKFGKENHRTVGYLNPEAFNLNGLLAIGKIDLSIGNYSGARAHFEQIIKKYPDSDLAEEAYYYLGVSRFKETNDPKALRWMAEQLHQHYPSSSWMDKAAPYLELVAK